MFEALALAARPISEADWGSPSQIAAENAFYDAAGDLGEEFDAYALKATCEEALDEALRLLRRRSADAS
jgi:hypothetical protein